MGLDLFTNDESDAEGISRIQIDKQFARRFEHNNKREDLHRFQELEKRGLVDDSSISASDSSDEDQAFEDLHALQSNKQNTQFFEALLRVRNHDPSLKLKETRLFQQLDGKSGRGTTEIHKKNKPMYLKDVNAVHLMESGPDFVEEGGKGGVRSYADEQEDLRKAVLDAVNDSVQEEGEFIKLKEKNTAELGVGESSEDVELQKKLDDYFGRDGQLGEEDAFLRNYFSNKMWVEEESGDKFTDIRGISDDEDDVEKQEDFEREYNFRHEEGMGDRVLGHARSVHGGVRKKKCARKVQRERKMEREVNAEAERKEELKRLKSLKKQEIIHMRDRINKTAGAIVGSNCPFHDLDFEKDFDPGDYDKMMGEMFDESYYNAEDADPDFDSGNDEYDDNLPKPVGLNLEIADYGFSEENGVILKGGVENGGAHVGGDEWEKNKKKKNTGLDDDEVEELYKLDYEDVIDDLKTRFKYTKVKSNRYGLKPDEILLMDEKELNQYVSLKRIVAFRDDEWKVPNNIRFEQKKKNMLLFEEFYSNKGAHGRKRLKNSSKKVLTLDMNGTDVENSKGKDEKSENGQHQEDNCNTNATTKESRKKRFRKKFKLSSERLKAYGKIIPKSKKTLKKN